MKQIEENIVNSFRLAKTDIIKTQKNVIEISKTQKRIIELLDEVKANQIKFQQKLKVLEEKVYGKKKTVSTRKKAVSYVAPKEGKKFHVKNCVFAQNIKPKNKVIFKSKTTALNQGLKPCRCVK